jgi:hypothetical protein
MTPRLQRQRPEPQSHLVRQPEPIRTGGTGPDTAAPEPQAPERRGPAPPASGAPRAARRTTARAPRSPAAAKPSRPAARDLIAPARVSIAREALKADVPAELELIQRLRRYRLDKGVDIRDQVAMAVDAWLTGEGY